MPTSAPTTKSTRKGDPYPPTPELEKLKAVQAKTQACCEFMDWLASEKGIVMGKYHQHDDACYTMDYSPAQFRERYRKSGIADADELARGRFHTPQCGCRKDELMPIHTRTEKFVAEFFEIDMDKVEAEKRAILDWQRRQNEK